MAARSEGFCFPEQHALVTLSKKERSHETTQESGSALAGHLAHPVRRAHRAVPQVRLRLKRRRAGRARHCCRRHAPAVTVGDEEALVAPPPLPACRRPGEVHSSGLGVLMKQCFVLVLAVGFSVASSSAVHGEPSLKESPRELNEARRTGWQLTMLVIEGLKAGDQKEFPGIQAWLKDFEKAAKGIDLQIA